ncbi:DUF4360 domain-containing protein [Actinomadura terrae]|uniref:DUF4360 domain-containing protein n=1 Tax=Actinomadura terrae TaxID=604353 RepID=UPI001FA7D939|nr:DUF4360 domain-containing protein [Actinomadura terrae]
MKTRNTTLVAIGAITLPLLTAVPASAAPKPAAKVQVIRSICPGEVSVSEDGGRVNVTIKNFKASVGPDVNPAEGQKSCGFLVNIHIPQGFTWAIANTDTRATADLDPEVVGEIMQSARMWGSPGADVSTHQFTGHKGNLLFTDKVPVSQLKYARCGAPDLLDLETRIRVTSSDPSGEGWVSLDFPEGGITYSIAYKKC